MMRHACTVLIPAVACQLPEQAPEQVKLAVHALAVVAAVVAAHLPAAWLPAGLALYGSCA